MTRFFILILIVIAVACSGRHNPNLSMEQLHALPPDSVAPEPTPELTMPEGYTPQPGVKYTQKRDMSAAPVRIDLPGGIKDVRPVTLSQIANDIEYINVGKHRFAVQAQLTPHGALISNNDGVWLYSPEGKPIRQIYKNLCEYEPWGDYGMTASSGDRFNGVTSVRYNEKDDRLWLQYEHSGQPSYLGIIDMKNVAEATGDEIKQDPVTLLAPFKKPGRMDYAKDYIVHKPWSWRDDAYTTYSFRGDTLCRFTAGYDSITAKALGGIHVDGGNSYMYRGEYTFRRGFSDTLFRMKAANVLKPEYLFDVGTSGRATNRGKVSDVQLEQMYIVQTVREDDRYLYITFTKNYDCPNTRNSRKVHFWWGLYDKAKREFFTLPFVSDSDPDAKGFENDIDGGIPFWPQQIGENGEMLMYTMGKYMKKFLTQSKTFDPGKNEQFKQFMKTLKDDDRVIIVVK